MSGYIKMSEYAHFQCVVCGYKWDAKPKNVIRNGTGCYQCSLDNASRNNRFSNEEVKGFIESQSCKWISGDYNNVKSILTIKFSCGHISDMTFASFRRGHRCYSCGRKNSQEKQRLKSSDIISSVESYGFKFIGFSDGYKNCRSLISYECKLGHITERAYEIFKRCPNCGECAKNKAIANRSLSSDDVLNYIISRNLKFIDGTYINDRSKLLIEFECGHQMWIGYDCLRNKKSNLCMNCEIKTGGIKRRTPTDLIIKEVENSGFVFCGFIDGHNGNSSKLQYFCKECQTITTRTVASFFVNKNCVNCRHLKYIENKKGANNLWWKGGISRISLYLRKFINDWYIESLQKNNYLCVITGLPAKAVHHLYSFHKIVDETIKELGLNKRRTVAEYSDEELNTISKLFLEKHKSYGLGVPLTKKCHNMFHFYYSKNNNTPEQFEEFRQRIKSGEIILPE
jgi:hypothetical protein